MENDSSRSLKKKNSHHKGLSVRQGFSEYTDISSNSGSYTVGAERIFQVVSKALVEKESRKAVLVAGSD